MAVGVLGLLNGCGGRDLAAARAVERQVMGSFDCVRDSSSDSLLVDALPDLNCLARRHLGRQLALSASYNPRDASHILLVPVRCQREGYSSVAYSSIAGHFILVQPGLIREFTRSNAIGDSTVYKGVFQLVLLHELGHFAIGKEGAFDEIVAGGTSLGETKRRSEPEFLNASKQVELEADSTAIAWVSDSTLFRDRKCAFACQGVETILPGMLFAIFGNDELAHFGDLRPRILRDPSASHPNLELRVAFMNYYMTHSSKSRELVDEYLYNREVLPIHLQDSDPAIYKGLDKILPTDRAQHP